MIDHGIISLYCVVLSFQLEISLSIEKRLISGDGGVDLNHEFSKTPVNDEA